MTTEKMEVGKPILITDDEEKTIGEKLFAKPEKKTPPRKNAAARKPTVPNRKGQFIEPLTMLYTTAGSLILPFDNMTGTAFIESAESCATTLDDLAYQNESVRRALHSLTQTSLAGAVLAAHAPILIAITVQYVPGFRERMKLADPEDNNG